MQLISVSIDQLFDYKKSNFSKAQNYMIKALGDQYYAFAKLLVVVDIARKVCQEHKTKET